MDTKEALNQLGRELATDREVTDNGSEGLQTQDDSGNYFALRLADIKEDHQLEPQMNFHERITRTNERHWPDEKVRPLRIGHVVYSLRGGQLGGCAILCGSTELPPQRPFHGRRYLYALRRLKLSSLAVPVPLAGHAPVFQPRRI